MTDSPDTDWGVRSPDMQTYRFWMKEEAQMSINVRELQSILFVLKLHAERFRNSTIKILTDNKTSIKYTTKAGGTASVHLQNAAVQMQDVCNSYSLQIINQYIKGINNVEADRLSRIKKLYETQFQGNFFRPS
ncbi:hypothetical protein RMATCC62417_14721 [Rhizopus microsporus]|nr:hypothetical protein RMATCC62417_14721 [Rhizopus microsporus]